MIKLLPYEKALEMGESEVKKTLIPTKVARAKKQAELEMCKIDEKLATKNADIQEACCRENVDFDHIIGLKDSIGLLDRKKKQYKLILDEMFPSVPPQAARPN